MKSQLCLATSLILACSFSPQSLSFADGGLQTIALSSDQAPGAESGVDFSRFMNAMLNNSGQVAFESRLSGTGVDPGNDVGIYRSGASGLAEVAREGNPAPGAGSGGVFSLLTLSDLNDAGQIAFEGRSTDMGVISDGLYRDSAGAVVEVVRTGSQAPGRDPGVVFRSFNGSPVLDESGQISFLGSLAGPGLDFSNDGAFYRESGGSLEEIAREEGVLPGSGVFASSFARWSFNRSGQFAFAAFLDGPGVSDGDNFGIYREDSGVLTELGREGDQVPGADPGIVFSESISLIFGVPRRNNVGQTVFIGSFDDPNLDEPSGFTVLREEGGALAQVIRRGGPAPGADPGVVLQSLSVGGLNDSGQVLIRAILAGATVNATNDFGLYREDTGVLVEVAREGNQPPGADSGEVFTAFQEEVLNERGQVAFMGFNTGNQNGIYATDLDGVLVEIAQEGDLLDVNDDPLVEDLRTIAFLSFFSDNLNDREEGPSSGFNDLGQIVFAAEFTDGSRGVFVSNAVATIPEPGSAWLTLLAGAVLLRRRR